MKINSVNVLILGRPSSGKSTFINTVCEKKVSITSSYPQTTLNRIKGIYNFDKGRIVFIDTPGFHISDEKLNKRLKKTTFSSLAEADVILYLIDGHDEIGAEEEKLIKIISESGLPVVVGINKNDRIIGKDAAKIESFIKSNLGNANVFRLSALQDSGVDEVLSALFSYKKEVEDDENNNVVDERGDLEFRTAELIREKVIENTFDEIPHSVYVELERMSFIDDNRKVIIDASVVCEKDSQKGIIIGKGGANIKKIRVASFKEIKKIFYKAKLELNLFVKVKKNWRSDDKILDSILSR